MAVGFDISEGGTGADVAEVSSASFEIASGSDRFALGVLHNGDFGNHATPVSFEVDSEAFTQLGTTQEAFFSNCFGSFWTLTDPGSGNGKVFVGTVSENQSHLALAGGAWDGVGSIGETVVDASGNEGNDYTLSVTLNCSAGDWIAVAVAAVIGGGNPVTVTGLSSTDIRQVEQFEFTAAVIADKVATGSTVNAQIRFQHAGEITAVMWGAVILEPAAGGGGIQRQSAHLARLRRA